MLARDLDRLGDAPAATTDVADAPAAIVGLDASGLPGVVALATAVRRAAEAVAESGIGVVGIRRVGALGILGLAARSLASRGLMAVVAAQSPAVVAPWGGQAAAVGTNPLAIAVPRTDRPPLVVDFATSALTLAAVREAAQRGEPLPAGGALDASGSATTDAAAVHTLLATGLVGSLTGLVVELLAGAGSGGRVAADATEPTRGAFLLAFDPARSGGADAARIAATVDEDWRRAGGHLPARFDALPDDASGLPGTIDLPEASVAWLRAHRTGTPSP
jgi:LDH2 family malate/lactate/ureidoglycolate dehydrogenase